MNKEGSSSGVRNPWHTGQKWPGSICFVARGRSKF